MYVLTIALSKYTFIFTFKLIISRENIDSKQVKNYLFFTCQYRFVQMLNHCHNQKKAAYKI